MPVTRNQAIAAAKSSSGTAGTSVMKGSSSLDGASTESETSRETCSICLGPFSNKSFTSSCTHSFCFVCLKQWSKVKAECPLCKQQFTGIFHNIRSNDNYDIYELPPVNPPQQIDYSYLYNYMGGHLATLLPAQHYFNVSQPGLNADLTLSNFSRFQFRYRRYDRTHSPEYSVHREHQYSYPSLANNHTSASSWPHGTKDFRLSVYRSHLGPPAVIIGCENSSYHLTPAMVAASSHRLHRIMPWLTRELRVLLRSHQNVRQAIGIIQPLLSQVTIDSPYFFEKVFPVVGPQSRQFVQEFKTFANSALSMQAFDRKAMYRCVTDRISLVDSSSSGSDDDVIEVTNVSPGLEASIVATSSINTVTNLQGVYGDSPAAGTSQENIVQGANSEVDLDLVSVSSEDDDHVFLPGLNDSDSDNSNAGSDIVFVQYDKPWSKRSPVQLSSDSDESVKNKRTKKDKRNKLKNKSLNASILFTKKEKGRKSTRGNKSKRRSWITIRDDSQQGSEINTPLEKTNSVTEKHKMKKRKKSKDNIYEMDNVGKQIVGAEKCSKTLQDVKGDGNASKKSKKSNDKDRERRKQAKNVTKKFTRPAILRSYKKHHSGHKKSSSNQHGHISRVDASPGHSSNIDSFTTEQPTPRSQQLAASDIGHSATSTFQTRPDNVQHIPLSLWVSTWQPHIFSTSSPSSSLPVSSLPHTLASSSLSNHDLNNTLVDYNSQIISSDSDSSSDSDTCELPDNVSALQNCDLTKQWLDANFSDLEEQSTTSSPIQNSSSQSNKTELKINVNNLD